MKNKIIDGLIIISIFILSILLIFKEGINDLDELWQYNFANNMSEGLVPYRDFNIITTPFFSFLASLFLKVLSNQLIVMRIFNTIIFASILIVAYKIFNILKISKHASLLFVLILYFLFYYDLGVEYNYLILLITLISLYIELCNIDKYGIFELKRDFGLGILIGLNIVTKHTIGLILAFIFIFYKILFIEEKEHYINLRKIIIYRILGTLLPCIILFLYLAGNSALYDCINYCILGISEFDNKESYLNLFLNLNILIRIFAFINPIILLSSIGLFRYRNNNEVKKILVLLIFSIAMFVGIFPIANSGHFIIYGFIGIITTLSIAYLICKKMIKNELIKIFINSFIKAFVLFSLIIYIIFGIINLIKLYKNNKIYANELEHYYGIIINQEMLDVIKQIDKFILDKKENGYRVLILDSQAVLFKIPINIYDKDYDMFNKGNFGKDGENRLIKEIKENKNKIYLILNDQYDKNWQTPIEIINYVKENKTKVGEIYMFDIYE